jgi:transposase
MDAIVCLRCRQLERRLSDLEASNQRLQAEGRELRRLLEESQRAAKRQAAPFSRGEPKSDPKKPGRKPGKKYGKKGHRLPPEPQQIDEIYEAPLPDACPDCGGHVDETHVDQQYQVEIPRKPIHRQFNVHIGHCQECGARLQGRHPLQTSDALGAAASQLGPDAQAGIVLFNKRLGVSHGKIIQALGDFYGIPLTRGGSAHTILRAGRRCEPVYQEIRLVIRRAHQLAVDETGWRIGGTLAWLHVWVARLATCYLIDPWRDADQLEALIGLDYDGILIHDGWSSYDRFERAMHQQCLAHPLRRARDLLQTATRGAVCFPRQVSALFQKALAVRDRFVAGKLSPARMEEVRWELTSRLGDLVGPVKLNADNERFAKHLEHYLLDWFTFLEVPGLDATNYRAEQAIRPAVVNRKVWGGSRTPNGAHAQSVLMSVLETCRQHGRSALDYVSQVLRGVVTSIIKPPARTFAR